MALERKGARKMQEIIEEILYLWGIEENRVSQIYSSAWEVGCDYVIKFYEDRSRLERNIEIMTILWDCGIPVAEILPTKAGEKYIAHKGHFFFLSKKLQGAKVSDLKDEKTAWEMGRAIARLHRAFLVCETKIQFWDNSLLAEMKAEFSTEHTISAEFDHKVDVKYIYMTDHVMDREELREALSANTTGETTYSVVQGDTFGAIAYANDMSITDLQQLNPDVDINRLMIGDVLNVKEEIPVLGVVTVDEITYTEAIPCPVEEVKDDTMYIGASKILVQGEEGESLVTAQVTYVNGKESERDIQSKETVREPTTTTKAVGTKEKPKTASTGQFSWPISGRINSYFGGRYIFGRYSYHSGLDIQASYGASIKAADGGTVTFAGWKGSYGNLVIITHDNGIQTYYAHNSSLLVSAGSKVYKGQVIAKAGSTGRSTGPHCHFEVRVNGSAVNPLSYLR